MHSASTHIYSLSLHDALPIWSQDFRTEPYTVQSHQIMGTVLQSGPKNLRLDRNFSVRSGLDRKLRSGPASLIRSIIFAIFTICSIIFTIRSTILTIHSIIFAIFTIRSIIFTIHSIILTICSIIFAIFTIRSIIFTIRSIILTICSIIFTICSIVYVTRLANSPVQSQTVGFLGTVFETGPYGLVSKWFGLK